MRLSFLLPIFLSLNVPNALAEPISAQAYREEIRDWVRSHASPIHPAIAPAEDDQAADLVDKLETANLDKMEQLGLLRAKLALSPWSDSYWPTYAGQLANRYLDPNYNPTLIWKANFNYLNKNLGKGNPNQMSPAEKYDLLVGDKSFTLAKKMMGAGLPYADREGKVETWFGICHGWSPASFMLPRPSHAVNLKAADGRALTFTPSDIKALGSLLWANGAGPTKFIGRRCNEKEPSYDDHGREKNPDCLDTNPATWHIAVVNQIGVSQRGFVMDASAGFEVWNQPVYGYSYSYVNPNSGESGKELAKAKVLLKDAVNDQFKKYRSASAVSLVEITMSVTYVAENTPSAALTDSPEQDMLLTVGYHYDLELDAADNIVGGEWHSPQHPDFLWVPVKGSQASSQGDEWLDSQSDHAQWNGEEAMPASWKAVAPSASSMEQPLARVVNFLFDKAK